MTQQQRTLVFYAAIAAAVVLALIGVLYLVGDFVPSGRHVKHALLAFALAVGALVVANFNRPSVATR